MWAKCTVLTVDAAGKYNYHPALKGYPWSINKPTDDKKVAFQIFIF
jgi:hypothetical protein